MKTLLSVALLFLMVIPAAAHSVVVEGNRYVVTHCWDDAGRQRECTVSVPISQYRYFQGRSHRSSDLSQFVLSDYGRDFVRDLADSFDGDLHSVVSFVQSLRYVSDYESKGEEEYVRFPMETLVDGIGDCEDLAILAAALLNEMGYRVLMVTLPEHMALAVNCDEDVHGTYYIYHGSRYYYLEVTHAGWELGRIPDEYRNSQVKLVPLKHQPRIHIRRCSYQYDSYTSAEREVPIRVVCDLENTGPCRTSDLSVRVQLKRRNGTVASERVFRLDDLGEGESSTGELVFRVPRPYSGEIEVRVEGENFDTESLLFEEIELR